MFKTLFLLPPTVWLLSWISFFNDTAGELVYSLLPIYVTAVLMAGPKALGLIEGIAESAGSFFKLFSGILSDRTRSTKPWVVGGYSLAAVSRPLLSLAGSWPMVLLLRFGDRLGKGLRTSPRDALLALSVPQDRRGLAFGFHRAFDSFGSVIGPFIAAWLLSRHMPIREIFLWVALPGAVTVLMTLLIREPARMEKKSPSPFEWNLRGFPPKFKRYLVVLALFTLGNASNTFLLLRAKDLGLPDEQVPLIWGVVSLAAALFSTPLSALSDRIGRTRLIVAGWTIYGFFYLFLGFNGFQLWSLWPLFAFYGLFMAATEGVEKALVADLAPSSLLGTAFGWFHLTAGFLLLPSSILFGWLWEAWSPQLAFSVSAGCAFLAAFLLKFWVIREPLR
jgi:MFS family permease